MQGFLLGAASYAVLAFEGDSITAWPPTTTGFPELTRTVFSPYSATPNFAIGGETISSLVSRAATTDSYYDATRRFNVLVVEIGTNDIWAGRTTTQVFDDLKAYCDARQAVGWKVVVATILPRLDAVAVSVGFNAKRATVNAAIRSDTSFYDALADIGDTGTTMGADTAPNDETLYETGKTHPTNPVGHALLGAIFKAAVKTLIP